MANYEHDADELHKAMKGVGTDEAALIKVLAHRTRDDIQKIAAAFEARHHKNLLKEITSETSGNFREVLVALVRPVAYYAAELVEKAVVGVGTNENMLIDVIAPLNSHELKELKEAFAKLYGKHEGALAERIKHDVSTLGDFGKLMQAVLEAERSSDPSKVDEDVEALFKAGEKRIGTDEEKFIKVVAHRTAEHMRAVSQRYKAKHGHDLEHAIKSETSGDFEKMMIALVTPRDEYFARRIHEAIAGAGTNDSLLVRCFGLNDKPHLLAIAKAYERLYGHSCSHDVKGDTSGDYAKLTAALLE